MSSLSLPSQKRKNHKADKPKVQPEIPKLIDLNNWQSIPFIVSLFQSKMNEAKSLLQQRSTTREAIKKIDSRMVSPGYLSSVYPKTEASLPKEVAEKTVPAALATELDVTENLTLNTVINNLRKDFAKKVSKIIQVGRKAELEALEIQCTTDALKNLWKDDLIPEGRDFFSPAINAARKAFHIQVCALESDFNVRELEKKKKRIADLQREDNQQAIIKEASTTELLQTLVRDEFVKHMTPIRTKSVPRTSPRINDARSAQSVKSPLKQGNGRGPSKPKKGPPPPPASPAKSATPKRQSQRPMTRSNAKTLNRRNSAASDQGKRRQPK